MGGGAIRGPRIHSYRKWGVWCVASIWRRGEDGEILSNLSVILCMYRGNRCKMAVVWSEVGVEGL